MMITKMNISASLLISTCFYFLNPTISNYNSDKEYFSTKEQITPLQESIARGKEVYTDFCIQCHLATGKGNGITFPPLDNSDWLKKKRKESIHAVKYGQKGEIVVNQQKYNGIMTPLGLSDQEVADVMNYILNSWSNSNKKMVTVQEVISIKE